MTKILDESKTEKHPSYAVASVKGTIQDIIDDLRNGRTGKKSTDEMIRRLNLIEERIQENARFYQNQVIEVGEKVTQQVRTEIENIATSAVYKLGLDKLDQLKLENKKE